MKNKKVVKLTESDLTRLVKRVIKEENEQYPYMGYSFNDKMESIEGFVKNETDRDVVWKIMEDFLLDVVANESKISELWKSIPSNK